MISCGDTQQPYHTVAHSEFCATTVHNLSFLFSFINCVSKNLSTDNKNIQENKYMYIQLGEREKNRKESSNPDGFLKSKLNSYQVKWFQWLVNLECYPKYM